jgi:DNA-binding XRE family transcriptional regulator
LYDFWSSGVDRSTGFRHKLRELRERAALTQPELARKADLSKDTVAQLEQGRYEPTWPTVLALADALGVSTEAFREPPAADVTPRGPGRPPKVEPPKVKPPKVEPPPAKLKGKTKRK